MIRRTAIALLALSTIATCPSFAAEHFPEIKRKIVIRVQPSFPQIARTMNISGVVKIEATVGNDGKPRLVDVKGGHPVLIQAAVDAVRGWRWESTAHETKEPIEVTFAPGSR